MHDPPKIRFKRLLLLAPAPGRCPVCAAEHPPDLPHNPASLYYQYQFYREHARWPTWGDAMEHCHETVKKAFADALAIHGIEIGAERQEQ